MKIGAMKDAWRDDTDGSETSSRHQPSRNHRPSLLNGIAPPPKRSVVMESLPSKEAADKLIVHFFSYFNPAIPARCKFEAQEDNKPRFNLSHRHNSQTHVSERGALLLGSFFIRMLISYSTTSIGPIRLKQRLSGWVFYLE